MHKNKVTSTSSKLDQICKDVKNMFSEETKAKNAQALNSYKKEIQHILASKDQLN